MSMELFLPGVCGSVAVWMTVCSVPVIVYRFTCGQVGSRTGMYTRVRACLSKVAVWIAGGRMCIRGTCSLLRVPHRYRRLRQLSVLPAGVCQHPGWV